MRSDFPSQMAAGMRWRLARPVNSCGEGLGAATQIFKPSASGDLGVIAPPVRAQPRSRAFLRSLTSTKGDDRTISQGGDAETRSQFGVAHLLPRLLTGEIDLAAIRLPAFHDTLAAPPDLAPAPGRKQGENGKHLPAHRDSRSRSSREAVGLQVTHYVASTSWPAASGTPRSTRVLKTTPSCCGLVNPALVGDPTSRPPQGPDIGPIDPLATVCSATRLLTQADVPQKPGHCPADQCIVSSSRGSDRRREEVGDSAYRQHNLRCADQTVLKIPGHGQG